MRRLKTSNDGTRKSTGKGGRKVRKGKKNQQVREKSTVRGEKGEKINR